MRGFVFENISISKPDFKFPSGTGPVWYCRELTRDPVKELITAVQVLGAFRTALFPQRMFPTDSTLA